MSGRRRAWLLAVGGGIVAACSNHPLHGGGGLDAGAGAGAGVGGGGGGGGAVMAVDASSVEARPRDALPLAMCAATTARALFVECTMPPVFNGGFDGVVQVVHWGTGFEGCLVNPGLPYDLTQSGAHLLIVATPDGSQLTFGLLLQDANPPIADGDVVHLSYQTRGGGFAPLIGSLELDTQAGALVLYVGVGGRPDEMPAPPGVTLQLGAEICAVDDDCGTWGRFAIQVVVQGSGIASLAPGRSARVGPYAASVGESQQQTGLVEKCLDWVVSKTTVVLTP